MSRSQLRAASVALIVLFAGGPTASAICAAWCDATRVAGPVTPAPGAAPAHQQAQAVDAAPTTGMHHHHASASTEAEPASSIATTEAAHLIALPDCCQSGIDASPATVVTSRLDVSAPLQVAELLPAFVVQEIHPSLVSGRQSRWPDRLPPVSQSLVLRI